MSNKKNDKNEYKPNIHQISFKTTDLDDIVLNDWFLDQVRKFGGNKSAYMKSVLREKMLKDIELK